jgi:hypothetical protein
VTSELILAMVDPAADFFASRARRTVIPDGDVDALVSLIVAVGLEVEDTKVVGTVPESSEPSVSPLVERLAPDDESGGPEEDDPEEALSDTGVDSISLGIATDPT